jgi:carboxyl-terminal processing protease
MFGKGRKMKLRYQLVTAVLIVTLMVGSFFAGRQFESLAAVSSRHDGLTRLVSAILTSDQARAAGIGDVDISPVERFQDVLTRLRRDYVSSLKDEDKLTNAAINGMLSVLRDPPYEDRYTRFLEPSDYRSFMEENEGHFGGIGAEIGIREVKKPNEVEVKAEETSLPAHCPECGADLSKAKQYHIVIVAPLPDSPAEKAGLHAGDRILKIGEKSAVNLTLGEAVREIKGRPGTVVDLQIAREGVVEPQEVKITRSIIQVRSAEYKLLPDKIGYLDLNAFNDTSPEMVKEALSKLRAGGMRALLLDLRGNPGGGLDVCVDVASNFTGEGPIVYIQERGGPREVRNASKGSKRFELPLIVLVDKGSASASEILSGAIQDYQVGKLLGTTTFGKGMVQTVFPLRDGSALTLTTAKYLTAKMRDIDHKGISPDIAVEQTKSEDPITPLSEKDAQAQAALKLLKQQLGAVSAKAA